jgi:hypothetical protein
MGIALLLEKKTKQGACRGRIYGRCCLVADLGRRRIDEKVSS